MHLNPFHPAYMHKKWCRKIDAKRQWHGGRGGGRRGGGGSKLDEAKIRARGKSKQRERQNRQYNYEQARSTRPAGRPAD